MILQGVITNVTNFGAFVDIGVHQDGLVHISALSEQFVKDPHTLVKAGDIVQVKVMEVEIERKRIALSMRLSDQPGASSAPNQRRTERPQQATTAKKNTAASQQQGSMAALFANAKQLKKK